MKFNFSHTTLGGSGRVIHRLGLSTTYRPGKKAIYKALDEGINFFFGFGIDTQMMSVMRDVLRSNREGYVVATGAYNLVYGHTNLRRTLEKRLRQLRTDYIDVFLFLGVLKEKEFPEKIREELYRIREEGQVRSIGLSTHDRKLAGKLAAEGAVDILMIRYNAAHRGAEEDIFPYLNQYKPGLVSYTATRWRYLLRKPSGWPKDAPIPTAGMCYRFVLSNPSVHVCLTAPSNMRQLEENIDALRQGPLSEEEMDFMREFGDAVHHTKRWFM
jgi:aryl-alcohol dehydrogenase-like predicted oxidoreductase